MPVIPFGDMLYVITVDGFVMLADLPIPQPLRLLDQLRQVLRYKHYSPRTEEAYTYWVRFFVRWHGRNGRMRHPRDMAADELPGFLTMLATERKVSVSTHNQALSALEGEVALLGKLLYGTGMRLNEGLRLRVKDVDFDRHVIVVRQAKGGNDRVVMLPRSLSASLKVPGALAVVV